MPQVPQRHEASAPTYVLSVSVHVLAGPGGRAEEHLRVGHGGQRQSVYVSAEPVRTPIRVGRAARLRVLLHRAVRLQSVARLDGSSARRRDLLRVRRADQVQTQLHRRRAISQSTDDRLLDELRQNRVSFDTDFLHAVCKWGISVL